MFSLSGNLAGGGGVPPSGLGVRYSVDDFGHDVSRATDFAGDIAQIASNIRNAISNRTPATQTPAASTPSSEAGKLWDDLKGTLQNIASGAVRGARQAASGAETGSQIGANPVTIALVIGGALLGGFILAKVIR